MTDVMASGPNGSGQKPTSRTLAFLGVLAAGVAGVAAFGDNLDKIGVDFHKLGESVGLVSHDPGKPPVLAGYDSPSMGGGSSPSQQCGPQLEAYRAQYPLFRIELKSWEDSDKDLLGHVSYRYHCRYSAAAN